MSVKPPKPTPDNELITHIRESLTGYEEEYVPGSWENFNRKSDKRRGVIFWLGSMTSAAALLFIGFFIFAYLNEIDKPPVDQLTVSDAQQNNHSAKMPPVVDKNLQANVVTGKLIQRSSTQETRRLRSLDNSPLFNEAVTVPAANDQRNPMLDSVTVGDLVVNLPGFQKHPDKESKPTISLDEFLANETRLNKERDPMITKTSNADKWEVGLVVAPSFGNTKKLNLGYGMSMAYNLSSKVALSSGVSYNEMGASKDVISGGTSAIAGENKSLESVSAQVSGIDIPLELRYNIGSKLYANLGVSAFAIVSQQQSNTYLQDKVVERTFNSPTGDVQSQSFVVPERITEPTTGSEADLSRFVGFYNISFGYKQRLSKDKYLGIEPFLKVPIKDATKENLRLLGTGFKIKLNF